MYLTQNERKPVLAERFMIILKNKIHKYITSVSKNTQIDKLDDIVNEYNNTYHSKVKSKTVDGKANTYIDSSKVVNNKCPKSINDGIVRKSKYKFFLRKAALQIGQKNFL